MAKTILQFVDLVGSNWLPDTLVEKYKGKNTKAMPLIYDICSKPLSTIEWE